MCRVPRLRRRTMGPERHAPGSRRHGTRSEFPGASGYPPLSVPRSERRKARGGADCDPGCISVRAGWPIGHLPLIPWPSQFICGVCISHRDYVTGYRHQAQDREEVYARRRVLFVLLPRGGVMLWMCPTIRSSPGTSLGSPRPLRILGCPRTGLRRGLWQGDSTATDTKPRALERQRLNDRVGVSHPS